MDFVVIIELYVCLIGKEPALPTVLRVETEQEREVTQQLKQANDTVARLQDELSDFRQRSAPLWEKEMKGRDSKIYSSYRHLFLVCMHTYYNYMYSIIYS